MSITTIRRPAVTNSDTLGEHQRWQKHTSDNIDQLNKSAGATASSYVAPTAAVPLTSPTVASITSIALGPGTWLLSTIGGFTGAPTGTKAVAGISLANTSFTTNEGDGYAAIPTMPTAGSDVTVAVSSYLLTLTAASTPVYLVAACTFSAGSVSAFGRISAARISS